MCWSTVIPADDRFDSRQLERIVWLQQGVSDGSPPFALLLNDGKCRVDVRGAPGTPSLTIALGEPGQAIR
ncbi:hypothetical protein DIE03_34780 [Burkholderia sp. Bp8992]|nr:hypothetical protein DIE03_34780 [Burkholderia sp. Bp8992]